MLSIDDNYFYCEKLKCLMRKQICLTRQAKAAPDAKMQKENFYRYKKADMYVSCLNCKQGEKVKKGTDKTGIPKHLVNAPAHLNKKCEICGKVFYNNERISIGSWERKRFCSDKCIKEHNRNKSAKKRKKIKEMAEKIEKYESKQEGLQMSDSKTSWMCPGNNQEDIGAEDCFSCVAEAINNVDSDPDNICLNCTGRIKAMEWGKGYSRSKTNEYLETVRKPHLEFDDSIIKTMLAGDDVVNHPKHYTSHPSGVECITVTEHMDFLTGNAMKYLWRAGNKGDKIQDLKKAIWYLERAVDKELKKEAANGCKY